MLRERNNNNNKQNDQFLLDIIGDNIRWKSNDFFHYTIKLILLYLLFNYRTRLIENFVSIFSLSFFPFFPPPSRTISIAFKKFPSPKNTKFPPGDYDSRNNDGSGGKLGLTEKFLRQIVSTVLIVQLWIKTLLRYNVKIGDVSISTLIFVYTHKYIRSTIVCETEYLTKKLILKVSKYIYIYIWIILCTRAWFVI